MAYRTYAISTQSKVAEHFFGSPRQNASSHSVFKTPWPGDPRVNLQTGKSGKAKVYQVRQLLAAIDRLSAQSEEEDDGN